MNRADKGDSLIWIQNYIARAVQYVLHFFILHEMNFTFFHIVLHGILHGSLYGQFYIAPYPADMMAGSQPSPSLMEWCGYSRQLTQYTQPSAMTLSSQSDRVCGGGRRVSHETDNYYRSSMWHCRRMMMVIWILYLWSYAICMCDVSKDDLWYRHLGWKC